MSIFDLRQAIESRIPWWLPLIPIAIPTAVLIFQFLKRAYRK